MINRVKEELGDLSVWTWLLLVLGMWQLLDIIEVASRGFFDLIANCT